MSDSTSTRREMTPEVKRGVTRWLVREIFGVVFVAALLLGVSGQWDWVMGWALVAVYAVWVGGLARDRLAVGLCPVRAGSGALCRADGAGGQGVARGT